MLLTITIAKVAEGYKIEPTSHIAATLRETHRWVRANFQVSPEEWSKVQADLAHTGKASIEINGGKFVQIW